MKILLAVDGSKYSMEAALKCCEIVSVADDTEIKIVSVADVSRSIENVPFGFGGNFSLTLNDELEKMANTFVTDARVAIEKKLNGKAKIETQVLGGSPKIEIVDEAEKWGADLIVVGSHGYGFFERMLIGSVSNAILHHAPCSVLVIKTQVDKTPEDNN